MTDLPSVTICVPTYGRTRFLGECLECFLRQDYEGEMRLWILNDRKDQKIKCNYGNVIVTNTSDVLFPIGRKRRYMVDRITTDYLCFWDDDDIYLPMRIRQGVDRMHPKYYASCECNTWVHDRSELLALETFMTPWGNLMLRPQLFDMIDWDLTLERSELDMLKQLTKARALRAETKQYGFPSFIYRRHRNNMSDFSTPTTTIASPKTIEERVDKLIEKGIEPSGTIDIKPKWDRDYLAWAEESLKAIKKKSR